MVTNKEIQLIAKELNLYNISNGTIDLEDEKVSNKEYLYSILLQEINIRHANKLKELRKSSKLPDKAFDYLRISEGLKWQIDRVKNIDFTNSNENIFVVGECSTGKTALASEIGNAALDKGAKVIYITIDNLLLQYKYKKKLWDFILNCDVVIVDELFYVQPTDEELLAIYKILIFLQETRTLILITNRALFTWKEMKVDTHLIETLQKRLIADAQVITLS